MGKFWVSKLFAPPPQGAKHSLHPPSIWIKLQAPVLKLPRNFLCPPFSMAKTLSAPLFVGVKLHLPPPLPFCSPRSLPLISDPSLKVLQFLSQAGESHVYHETPPPPPYQYQPSPCVGVGHLTSIEIRFSPLSQFCVSLYAFLVSKGMRKASEKEYFGKHSSVMSATVSHQITGFCLDTFYFLVFL